MKSFKKDGMPLQAFCVSVRYAHYIVIAINLSSHLIVIKNIIPQNGNPRGLRPLGRVERQSPLWGLGQRPNKNLHIFFYPV